MKPKFAEDKVLLVVDIQNDFCPGGALAVPEGDRIIPVVNRIANRFTHVVFSQDWHPRDHFSFASAYEGKKPLDTIEVSYGTQILWPDHCVQGIAGAEFHRDLSALHCELILRKGFNKNIDSYSVFFENDHRTSTGLAGYLRERGLNKLYMVGLATDFCILFSTLDARRLGFEVTVIEDGVRGIDVKGSLDEAWRQMEKAGVRRIRENGLEGI